MLDLQQLHYFVAVAELESIARAAERLHISQSPLSRQIIALETRIGFSLFERSGKRLNLNLAGRRFLAESKALLSAAQRLEARAGDESKGLAGNLTIGYVESAMHAGVFRRGMLALKRRCPAAGIQLQALRTADQFDAIRQGALDVGFAHRAHGMVANLESRRIFEEPYLLAVPVGHRLASEASSTAKALDGEDFIFLPQHLAPAGHAQMLAACQLAGFEPSLRHEAADPSVALELVACGLGLAIAQASLKRIAPPGVRLIPLPKGFVLKLEVHLITNRVPTPLAEQLSALLPTV
ncbi:LysR substrate-binding domain-containing protein [Ottowia thiooxydans]|uniref:LysR substrate-binding domain-containing protein n=1 Tax=Ottowia thiooxydans TaxID=219182 RepID=UPI00041E66A1|nr:LysR substrate-binding domain-containing protein [Ottowia thiooxydans]